MDKQANEKGLIELIATAKDAGFNYSEIKSLLHILATAVKNHKPIESTFPKVRELCIKVNTRKKGGANNE
jgi:hypothetical protein